MEARTFAIPANGPEISHEEERSKLGTMPHEVLLKATNRNAKKNPEAKRRPWPPAI
jgi:hypothetical protein